MTTHSSKSIGKYSRCDESKPKSKRAKAGDERVRQDPASLIERNNTAVLVTGDKRIEPHAWNQKDCSAQFLLPR